MSAPAPSRALQNEIVSPVEGTIKSLEVAEGESIDAKRVICEIE